MSPLYNADCEKCKIIWEDIICSWQELQTKKCPECGQSLIPRCECINFQLKYDPKKDLVGWSYDGYAKSQYYRAVDEANEKEGKIVSGPSFSGKSQVYKGQGE